MRSEELSSSAAPFATARSARRLSSMAWDFTSFFWGGCGAGKLLHLKFAAACLKSWGTKIHAFWRSISLEQAKVFEAVLWHSSKTRIRVQPIFLDSTDRRSLWPEGPLRRAKWLLACGQSPLGTAKAKPSSRGPGGQPCKLGASAVRAPGGHASCGRLW